MSERETQGIIGIVLIAIALIGLMHMFQGCSSWKAGKTTIEVISRMADSARVLPRPLCEARSAVCKAENRLDPANKAGCPELTECQKVERELLAADVVAQLACDAALAAIRQSDQPRFDKALLEALRQSEQIKAALKTLGVKVP